MLKKIFMGISYLIIFFGMFYFGPVFSLTIDTIVYTIAFTAIMLLLKENNIGVRIVWLSFYMFNVVSLLLVAPLDIIEAHMLMGAILHVGIASFYGIVLGILVNFIEGELSNTGKEKVFGFNYNEPSIRALRILFATMRWAIYTFVTSFTFWMATLISNGFGGGFLAPEPFEYFFPISSFENVSVDMWMFGPLLIGIYLFALLLTRSIEFKPLFFLKYQDR